jgi:hypothetical protein
MDTDSRIEKILNGESSSPLLPGMTTADLTLLEKELVEEREKRLLAEKNAVQVRRNLDLSTEIIGILNASTGVTETIKGILAAIQKETGFDAVGIRLRSGKDFPYFAQNGFSGDFLLTENTLVVRNKDGGQCRDKNGEYKLECTCGLVISGKTDPANPLFTDGGSFWTNDSLPILDLPGEQDPRLHPRNKCIHDGYFSIALIPIRSKGEIVGLLQLNGREKDMLIFEQVHYFERLSASIGVALMRKLADEELKREHNRLQKALKEVKTLRGFIPICASCKKVRVDDAYWEQLEVYIHDHTEAELSHGLCPECIGKLYPGLCEKGRLPEEVSSPRNLLSATPTTARSY